MPLAKISNIDGRLVIILPDGYVQDGVELSVRRHGNALILEPVAADWVWLKGITSELDSEVLSNAAAINTPQPIDLNPPVNLDLLYI